MILIYIILFTNFIISQTQHNYFLIQNKNIKNIQDYNTTPSLTIILEKCNINTSLDDLKYNFILVDCDKEHGIHGQYIGIRNETLKLHVRTHCYNIRHVLSDLLKSRTIKYIEFVCCYFNSSESDDNLRFISKNIYNLLHGQKINIIFDHCFFDFKYIKPILRLLFVLYKKKMLLKITLKRIAGDDIQTIAEIKKFATKFHIPLEVISFEWE